MQEERLIWAGEDPNKFTRQEVGGKGLNLLRLYQIAQTKPNFQVPNFFIIPEMYPFNSLFGYGGCNLEFTDKGVELAFDKLRKPVIARSSSTLEDGINASFAGMFVSVPNQETYEQLTKALGEIHFSGHKKHIQRYAERMCIDTSDSWTHMIVQEQVPFSTKGVIQLDENGGTVEEEDSKGRKSSHEIDYSFLKEYGPFLTGIDELLKLNYFAEGHHHAMVEAAIGSKERLGLEGTVQIEFCQTKPNELPYFVQIRQLPRIKSHTAILDMDIPEGVPYIESQVCNGVAGEVVLPAYVTFSQSGFIKVLVESGCYNRDARMTRFYESSKLAGSEEFNTASNAHTMKKIFGLHESISVFEDMWRNGNEKYSEYILVCDKLDESICSMNHLTEGKKGIITCLEASKTSHAMTVARDLGIPAMGVEGDMSNMNYFYNQVESGDRVHMKSDGKRAIAYVEKPRE